MYWHMYYFSLLKTDVYIGVDGTCSYRYNKNNESNKNREVTILINYLRDHHDELIKMFKNKTIVLVCDRTYHSMNLFETCDQYKIKYVIRVRDNCNNDNIRKITKVHILEDILAHTNNKYTNRM